MADNEYLNGKLQVRGTAQITATHAKPGPAEQIVRHTGSDLRDGKGSKK